MVTQKKVGFGGEIRAICGAYLDPRVCIKRRKSKLGKKMQYINDNATTLS